MTICATTMQTLNIVTSSHCTSLLLHHLKNSEGILGDEIHRMLDLPSTSR
jgi:hypothetical protein